MRNILYYPCINLPNTDWTIRALLYYDRIGSIAPAQYFEEPECFDPFMRDVVRNELIEPMDPMMHLEHPTEVSEEICEYLKRNAHIIKRRKLSLKTEKSRLHVDKFNPEILTELTRMGVAERVDWNWYNVERKTANELMMLLASVVANKIDYLPATDEMNYDFSFPYIRNESLELRMRQYRRDLILKNLIPYPKQIDLTRLRHFKDRHSDLLKAFGNKVEQLVFNPNIEHDSYLFELMLMDMKNSKDELCAKMNESHMGDIVLGSICGSVSAVIGFLSGSVLGVPGLLNTIYSACKIERPENVSDQTGLKYLALVDKRLRRKNEGD